VIRIASPATPGASEEPADEAAATETPRPRRTATTETGRFSEGDVATVTEDGVNLRSGPSTDDVVVTALGVGQQVRITGPSEEGDDRTWWPVTLVDDESINGYVADDFLEPAEE